MMMQNDESSSVTYRVQKGTIQFCLLLPTIISLPSNTRENMLMQCNLIKSLVQFIHFSFAEHSAHSPKDMEQYEKEKKKKKRQQQKVGKQRRGRADGIVGRKSGISQNEKAKKRTSQPPHVRFPPPYRTRVLHKDLEQPLPPPGSIIVIIIISTTTTTTNSIDKNGIHISSKKKTFFAFT